MGSPYTPSTVGPLTLSYLQVSDGDKRKAASINPGLSTMSDDIAKLAAGKQKLNPSIPRTYAHFEYAIHTGDTAYWEKQAVPVVGYSNIQGWQQAVAPTGALPADWPRSGELELVCDFPHGASLNGFAITVKVPVGPHLGLPTTMPQISLSKINIITGVATSLGSAVDPSGSVGAYETAHIISIPAFTEVIDRTGYVYRANIFGERGTNALPSLVALAGLATFDISAIDQGAG